MKFHVIVAALLVLTFSGCALRSSEYVIKDNNPGSPCLDSTLIALKSRSFQDLSESERSMLSMKELACAQHRTSVLSANRIAGSIEAVGKLQVNLVIGLIGVGLIAAAVMASIKK
jgi:hypothetical protein